MKDKSQRLCFTQNFRPEKLFWRELTVIAISTEFYWITESNYEQAICKKDANQKKLLRNVNRWNLDVWVGNDVFAEAFVLSHFGGKASLMYEGWDMTFVRRNISEWDDISKFN